MAFCKICGRPVITAKTVHSACWEAAVNSVAEKLCEDFCRWPRACSGDDDLELHCDECPMNRLLKLGM